MSDAARIRQIFVEAQLRDARERESFVREACNGDDALEREVLSLLEAATGADDFFADFSNRLGLAEMLGNLDRQRETPWQGAASGENAGPYTLIEQIGTGGMGTVWLAERSDGRYEGTVAIKLLAIGGFALQRFELEGRYLARLTHPNIARLLDAGMTDAGQPFLVLEYADGKPIDDYCDETRLGINARIRLFLDVMAAVSHAHTHLIIHRDIKPSNVMVSKDGVVKLLDFGVAKLLSGDAGTNQTREIDTALTPEYAAPEQLEGADVTTATDVYALGMLLYSLLAGRNPRSVSETGSVAEIRAMATKDPPKLSDFATDPEFEGDGDLAESLAQRSTTSSALKRTLRGDLDNILLKALAVEPERRYTTVNDFAADLRRYLNDEPVSAQPPTVTYRVGKFVRRHRGGVLVATLMLIALIGATVITGLQMLEAQQQRDRALYQQQRVQATNSFLGLLLSDAGSDGQPLTLVQLLDRGVELLDRKYGVEDRFIASTLYDVSSFYSALGEDRKRIELIDRASDIARAHDETELLGRMLCSRARIEMYRDPAVARNNVDEGNTLIAGIRNASDAARVSCHRADGLLLAHEGDPTAAETAYRKALAILESSPVNPEAARGSLLNDIAEQYFNTDRPAEAIELLDESLAIAERTGRGDTVSAIIRRFNRAAVVTRMGEVLSAAQDQQNGLERLDRIGRPLIGTKGHYAGNLQQLERYEEALTLFREELDDAEAAGNVRWAASNAMQVGRTLALMGRPGDAKAYLDRAEQSFMNAESGQQRNLGLITLTRIEILLRDNDPKAAERMIGELLEGLDYPQSVDGPGTYTALTMAARIAIVGQDYDAALTYANDAYDIAIKLARDPDLSADVGTALLLRGKSKLALNNKPDANRDLQRALVSLGNGYGSEHTSTREVRALLAEI